MEKLPVQEVWDSVSQPKLSSEDTTNTYPNPLPWWSESKRQETKIPDYSDIPYLHIMQKH